VPFFIYILAVSKCLTANLLKYLCGSIQQCLLYTVGLKIASDLAFIRYSNGGTLGTGRLVFIGGALQLELALKFNICHSDKPVFKRSRYSTVCLVTRLRTGRFGVRIPSGVNLLLSKTSRLTLGRTQLRILWVPGFFTAG